MLNRLIKYIKFFWKSETNWKHYNTKTLGIRMDYKERLKELIIKNAFKYSEVPIFLLASGKKSSYYFNCKAVTLDPEGRKCIGEVAYALTRSIDFEGVGGLTLGADPISIAISDAFFRKGKRINSFVVRKEAKKHGTGVFVEGEVKSGTAVIIAEDVITTGQSTIKAIERARDHGLEVKSVLTLIDREEGGREAINKLGVPVQSLFTRSELMKDYKEVGI